MTYKIPDNIQKLIREFEQKDINKIFQVGNTITFFIKNADGTHPVKLGIIDSPVDTGDQPTANLFFAKSLSAYPIDIRGAYFMITHPNQDIRSGRFDVLLIGKTGPNGFVPTKTKSRYTFKNIFKVDARDSSNKLIDSYYTNEHDAAADSNQGNGNTSEKANGFIELVNELQKGEALVLTLADKSVIKLDFIDTKGDSVQFEFNNDSDLSASYKNFAKASSIELSKNPGDITADEKADTISLKAKMFHPLNGEMVATDGTINNIEDFSLGDASIGGEEDNSEEKNTETLRRGKKAMEAILSDPNLQQAFFKQPSFFNLFKAEMTGKRATGTGIITAINIVNNYMDKKETEKLGATFTQDKKVIFSPLREVSIAYQNKNAQSDKFVMVPTESYTANVKNKQLDDVDRVLENLSDGFKVLVKEKTDQTDTFLCQVIKLVTVGKTKKEYPSKDLVRIKFSRESPGYAPITVKKQKPTPAQVTPKPTK